MTYNNRPTLKNLFEMEEVVTVKKSYRRKYKINWKQFFINVGNLIAFWKPKQKRNYYRTIIVPATPKDVIAEVAQQTVNYATKKVEN